MAAKVALFTLLAGNENIDKPINSDEFHDFFKTNFWF